MDMKRAKVIRRPWSTIHRWMTRDGRHAVEQSHIEYGCDSTDRYADQFRVLTFDATGSRIVSRHRRKSAALRALARLVK